MKVKSNTKHVCMTYGRGHNLEDIRCKTEAKFICQFNPCTDTKRKCPNSSVQSKPPHGFVYVAQTGKYYRPYTVHKGFLEALEVCQAEGGTIIEFRTPAEHNVLNQMQSEKKH